eukprot:200143-Pleurochrysis_carterae.AAC.1
MLRHPRRGGTQATEPALVVYPAPVLGTSVHCGDGRASGRVGAAPEVLGGATTGHTACRRPQRSGGCSGSTRLRPLA